MLLNPRADLRSASPFETEEDKRDDSSDEEEEKNVPTIEDDSDDDSDDEEPAAKKAKVEKKKKKKKSDDDNDSVNSDVVDDPWLNLSLRSFEFYQAIVNREGTRIKIRT